MADLCYLVFDCLNLCIQLIHIVEQSKVLVLHWRERVVRGGGEGERKIHTVFLVNDGR